MIQDITEGEVEINQLTNALGDGGESVDADAPIIKLVNQMIVDAFKIRASDIHLEPLAKRFRLRLPDRRRLHEQHEPRRSGLQAPIIARLKIQSDMCIAERRIPQDGRIQSNVGGKDHRPSCQFLPPDQAWRIDRHAYSRQVRPRLGLAELGFLADDQATFERLIGLPDGILLVTGPTGSGKTTTLYSCLNYINRPDRKIITVEDPVEYMLAGINQVQVHEHIGFTFAAALRSMLRQAPNVIMLGEIRDMETATIAINASLTGPPGLFHAPHQRRAQRGHPSDRHRCQAVPGGIVGPVFHGPAPGPQDLQGLRGAHCTTGKGGQGAGHHPRAAAGRPAQGPGLSRLQQDRVPRPHGDLRDLRHRRRGPEA